VVAAAHKALDSGNVNLVLVWVQKKDESDIRNMFQKTVAVRKTAGKRRTSRIVFLRDLVRIHRAAKAPVTRD